MSRPTGREILRSTFSITSAMLMPEVAGLPLPPTPTSRAGGPPGSGGGEAAVDGADVVARREDADGATFPSRVEPLLDQLAEHGHEPRVRPNRRGADHVQAEVRGGLAGLLVEVV